MLTRTDRAFRCASSAIALAAFAAIGAGCSGSTIHTVSDVGGVDTLSLDAKQRLVFVANRPADEIGPVQMREGPKRVTCTEPMPDALVARAAVLAGSGNFQQPGGVTAGGGVSGGLSESAASIGFRNESVQMLRDGYYRLCEAYMNGALTKGQYQHMILNADTFMVVISALQTLGNDPVAQNVGITTGAPTVSPPASGTSGQAPGISITGGNVTFPPASAVTTPPTPKPKSAEMAAQIVRAYLQYRMMLAQAMARSEAQELAWERRYAK